MPSRIVQNVPVGNALKAAPQSDVAAPQGQARPRQGVTPQATLKLSFGGVDFSLVPKTSRDGTVTFQAMGANEAVLSLKNFTGNLTVTSTPNNAYRDNSNSNNLVEDAGSPSPERPLVDGTSSTSLIHQPSPTQQQLTNMAAWNGSRKTGTPPTGAALRGMSQAPTPTTRNSSIEQVVQANRSSPLPYHSPVKRSRKNPTATKQQNNGKAKNKKARTIAKSSKPLSEKLPPSPICLGQKSPASSPSTAMPDCSQTMPSQPSTSTSSSEKQQQEEDEQSVATRNADDDYDVEMAIMDSDDKNESDDHDSDSDDDNDDELKSDKKKSSSIKSSNNKTEMIIKAPSPPPPPELVTPSPRWGHTMTMIDHNRLLMYGGQSFQAPPKGSKSTDVVPCTMSDVHVFEMDKQKWFKPVSCGEQEKPRQWHTMTFLPQRQLLICFGGETMNPKTGRVTTSDKNNLMFLDTEILLWFPPSVSGDVPHGRSGHSASLLPSSQEIVFFGGAKGGKQLNTIAVLDTTRLIWKNPKVAGVAPKARSYHSATAILATHVEATNEGAEGEQPADSNSANATDIVRQRVVIFGGNDDKESFNEIHVLEKMEGAETSWRWFHPTVTGTPPGPRTGHSATLMTDQKTICIYGGWDPSEDADLKDDEIIFQDSFLLDTDTWTWKQGTAPVFNGHSMDATEGTDGGPRRTGHAAVLNTVNNNSKNEVMVFGGRVPGDDFVGDFQTLTMP